MEKERNSKVVAIVALLIGVIGLSIGFAAFSNTLTIKSSATVTPDAASFNVDFSTANDSVTGTTVTPKLNKTVTGFTATDATIDNTSAPTISNLSATFTEPGQEVSYEFYAYNAGEYAAYLNSIAFANIGAGTGQAQTNKVCTVVENTENPELEATDELAQAACNGITISVDVGALTNITSSQADISSHELAKTSGEKIVVTIKYAEGSQKPDGDISVAFGDITLGYSSVD